MHSLPRRFCLDETDRDQPSNCYKRVLIGEEASQRFANPVSRAPVDLRLLLQRLKILGKPQDFSIYIYIYAFTLKFFLPGIARPRILLFRDIGGAVNVLVDDPIVGKLEESPRVFPRGENNVVVASLERNNRSQTDFLRTYRGTESVRDRHTLHLSKLIVISLNRELFLRVKSPFVLRTAYYGQVLYTFHIHVTFASRNDSWTVWWVKEGLKIKAIEVARNACKVVAACNCDSRRRYPFFILQGLVILLSCLPSIFFPTRRSFTRENSKDKAEVGSPRWIDLTIRVSRDASLDHVSM